MKHAPKNKSKKMLIATALVVIIGGTGLYFIGNANNNKHKKDSDSSLSVSFTSHVSSSTSNFGGSNQLSSSQSNSSTQLTKGQESKQSTQKSSSQSSSLPTISNQDLTYYNGQTKVTLPTTNGSIAPNQNYTDGVTFWTATLTINGKKENVVASYERQGYFAIFTKEPTSKPQGFTYNGGDYNNHIGDKDLDSLASSSKTVRY
ncbi:hypothetical protein [Fructobacillus cardui]|uniref:hypothetical protein n=1 Tax=Fructobacillus cardui TaxID=2893170 RepID=UPI00200A708E|nr:hypothetical protein [Fructobacillus cardui]MCK8627647.1 hypothetical protein [Fructobacillus cardui]